MALSDKQRAVLTGVAGALATTVMVLSAGALLWPAATAEQIRQAPCSWLWVLPLPLLVAIGWMGRYRFFRRRTSTAVD